MSEQPIRRVLFSCPPTPRQSPSMKTMLKPKEELRSFNPVTTPTSGTNKRKRAASFESTTLKDICDSSPVPLPIAAAAAAAAAAKRINEADGEKAVEEMVRAAGQVLNAHAAEESEKSKRISTPVHRKSVTFAEPLQVYEEQHSLANEDFRKPEFTKCSGADNERNLNAIGGMSATESDATDGEEAVNKNRVRPNSSLVHRSSPPENRQQSENRRVEFEQTIDGSAISNGREKELERMLLVSNEKRYLETSPFSCNEEITSQRNVFPSEEKVRTKQTRFTKDQERRGNGAFDSQPLEEEAESHIPASRHPPTRTQSKLELKLSNSFGRLSEVGQCAFKEDSAKSSITTESDTSELGSIQRAWKRSQRKRRLSEVFKLQKSLATAIWTDSRMVQRQTEAIVISDNENPATPSRKNSKTPKDGNTSVKIERSEVRSDKASNTMVSRSMSKYEKNRGIVKPRKSASAHQRGTSGSSAVASRTRSKTGGVTRSRLQKKTENVPLSLQDRVKSKKSAKKSSRATEEVEKETTLTRTRDRKHEGQMVVKTPKSSKRKSSKPAQISVQDVTEEIGHLASAGAKGGREASKTSNASLPHISTVQKLSLHVDEADFYFDGETDFDLSSDGPVDPLRELVKVKLNKKMWDRVEQGWAVHNDITSRSKTRLNSSVVSIYVESPFGCGDHASTFAADFTIREH